MSVSANTISELSERKTQHEKDMTNDKEQILKKIDEVNTKVNNQAIEIKEIKTNTERIMKALK